MVYMLAKTLLRRISRSSFSVSPCASNVSFKCSKCSLTQYFYIRNSSTATASQIQNSVKQKDEEKKKANENEDKDEGASSYTVSKVFGESYAPVPISAVSGSVIGKRFYKSVGTRLSDDGMGWTVMLDYRTLKTPSKRILKLPTLSLAKAVAAEWEYQIDGIRPFTMPLMRLSCTALERVPLTREKTIESLMKRFDTDLVFCRAPDDGILTQPVHELQVKFLDPLFDWMEMELGSRPLMYTSIFAGKQPQNVLSAMEKLLRKTNNWELAAIDALSAAVNSLVISFAVFRGRLDAEEALKLSRIEEDLQVERWGLVEGGHDVDIADLRVQVYSAVSFLGLSKP